MIAAHESYENRNARFWIEKGILFFEYKPNTAIDLEVAMRVVADRIAFQNERLLPVFCDTRGIASIDKAARDYLAKSGSLLAKAVALIGSENVSMTMSTFYLEISKPSVPTQIFTIEQEALDYLKGFL
ncbi:hypothetical protein QQY79_21320 [Flavobacterium tructae]|uniref:DUF7793 family protein n=1 Tax=Flavobacterium TaxID=237 RepID=UPI0022243038|nr:MULTISPECIES: hypothetical protein [Flavobacterium]MDL2145077.1 hypothetical protein [Flavobacterium tructae]GIQ60949.1 hypothetical protein Flavo103_40850 [Flavobacterium collinsii]